MLNTRLNRSISVSAKTPFLSKLAWSLIEPKLKTIREGRLSLVDATGLFFQGSREYGQAATDGPELSTSVVILRPEFLSRAVFGGSIGVGESYTDGDWECTDLIALTRIFVRNREVLNGLDSGWGRLMQPFSRAIHRLSRSNTLQGSKKNIEAHYDLGNDFFELFLDSRWMYSSGIFSDAYGWEDLDQAQYEKIDRICRKLNLKSGMHVLEIGTGWGGFAVHAASKYGCQVTTTTISDKQYDLACRRVSEAGLTDKVHVLKMDYRELPALGLQFDALVSIEMIEAVGLELLPTYFQVCSDLLKPGAEFLLQSILIKDQYYDQAARSVDFIQAHVFPGSGIPSVSKITQTTKENGNLRLIGHEDIGRHYAQTLELWNQRLMMNRERVLALGYSAELFRLWRYYFAYCAGGFYEESISCAQMHFRKGRS